MRSIPKTAHKTTQEEIQPDQWTHAVPLTEKQIETASNGIKHDLTELGYYFKYITCDNCDIKSTCVLAFDIYNTDGDCLLK